MDPLGPAGRQRSSDRPPQRASGRPRREDSPRPLCHTDSFPQCSIKKTRSRRLLSFRLSFVWGGTLPPRPAPPRYAVGQNRDTERLRANDCASAFARTPFRFPRRHPEGSRCHRTGGGMRRVLLARAPAASSPLPAAAGYPRCSPAASNIATGRRTAQSAQGHPVRSHRCGCQLAIDKFSGGVLAVACATPPLESPCRASGSRPPPWWPRRLRRPGRSLGPQVAG